MPKNTILIAKLKALATHLGLSIVLLGGALALMLLRWFPSPLFITDGVGEGLKILVGVDLVLGPLLTLIAYSPSKARHLLLLDFAIIAAVQLGAFGYGIHNIHKVRVQAVAYSQGEFFTETPQSFEEQRIPDDFWPQFGQGEPYLVNVRAPETDDEKEGAQTMGAVAGLGDESLYFLYEPFANNLAQHLAEGWSLSALESKHPDIAANARQWLQSHPANAEQARFYRVTGYRTSAILVLSGDGRWLGGFAGNLPKLKATPKPAATPPSSPAPASAIPKS
jgi:hypothetical protein